VSKAFEEPRAGTYTLATGAMVGYSGIGAEWHPAKHANIPTNNKVR